MVFKLALLGLVALTAFYGNNVEGVRMCGRRLADLLNFICEKHGGFHAPRRDVSHKSDGKRSIIEIIRPLSRRQLTGQDSVAVVEAETGFRSGVVDECCRKQCTLTTLVSYCANSRHVGNIDLDEILPPGSETLSAEDFAEYQLQQDSSKDVLMPRPLSPVGSLVHASRPNLGSFSRNRPVFMVLSQLQDDEDRPLGDYRF
ncbi:insulin-like [Parasteatoda tepidariorum]|uniref:insulin-like n=1 Tax=Parasteatoda tepidariorum TaxID=114398 RepID=UPI00077F8979|nr:uncharacterized protein LOC107444576 [Parasteatoda tepidariorum]